jgi:serpin B
VMAALAAPAQDSNELAVVTGMNRFAFDLYAQLRGGDGNLFYSPYSLSTALAMTYGGARGLTATQMAAVLHFTLQPENLHPACGALMRRLGEGAQAYELKIANRLWAQIGQSLLDPFVELTRTEYSAEVTAVDFRTRADTVRLAINQWVESQTAHRIRDLLKPGVVNAETRMLLVNAIYFKGKWQHPFERRSSQDAPFIRADGKESTAWLMHQSQSLRYAEDDAAQALELPYGGGSLSMVIFLPRRPDGIGNLEAGLTADSLGGRLSGLEKQEVEVYLPRFKLTSEFELAKTLRKMGMELPFTTAADFSGITGQADLFLSAVVHQAFVDVNEEGTEAAAATGAVMMPTSIRATQPVVFRADHPFIFLIRDRSTGAILFIGRLMDPA